MVLVFKEMPFWGKKHTRTELPLSLDASKALKCGGGLDQLGRGLVILSCAPDITWAGTCYRGRTGSVGPQRVLNTMPGIWVLS